MPTKDELTKENAELRARVKELEEGAGDGGGDAEPVDWDGNPLEEGKMYLVTDAGLVEHEVEEVEEAGAGDPELGGMTGDDAITMLKADIVRVTAERDDARHKLAMARSQLSEKQSLHGTIDNLPPVV